MDSIALLDCFHIYFKMPTLETLVELKTKKKPTKTKDAKKPDEPNGNENGKAHQKKKVKGQKEPQTSIEII